MAKIQIMDELLSNKIAAGEVVEKCVSVVKELVENSIDAGATEIKVELKESGTKEIKVTDNGSGMNEEDAVLCFSRHASSKLTKEEDLYRINTLGFRGEALASIASVSIVTLQTSTGEVGTIVKIKGGKITSIEKGDSRKGSIMTIENLFFNTPARLKHLGSLYAELANITDFMNKIALSHPNIKFVLTNDQRTILNTDGSANLLKVIYAIYGVDVAKKMLAVKGENTDYQVTGYISKPEVTKSNRNHIITLVNGRVVKNAELNRTINDSYHTYKPEDRYPIVVLEITTDPTLVDVNIHPTKMDIKFSKLEALKDLIRIMIQNTLLTTRLIPKVESKKEDDFLKETSFKTIEQLLPKEEKEQPSFEVRTLDLERSSVKEDTTIYTKEIILDLDMKKEKVPELYVVGNIHGTYIVCQNELGMYVIDQHAAKERINYEIYKKALGNPKPHKLDLLIPIVLEFSNQEYIILKENRELLEQMGFETEEMGINTLCIKAHPTWLPKYGVEEAVKKILELVIQKEKDFSIEKFNDRIAMNISCKMSIKANDNISIEEMEHLIDDLRKTENPFTCPHGRPTIIHYSFYELEKLFKRVM